MSPRTQQFKGRDILEEAVNLVREGGMAALSARALAGRLGSSVAPVYAVFSSMEGLRDAVLLEAKCRLDATIRAHASGRVFLDMGLGMIHFARDEEELYWALVEDGGSKGPMGPYMGELRRSLSDTAFLGRLDRKVLDGIFERMWLFTLGLATAMRHGWLEDPSDEELLRLLSSQGALVMVGEAEAGGGLGLGEELVQAFLSRREKAATDGARRGGKH